MATNYVTLGTVTGVLSFLSMMSVGLHMPALTAFISDPATAAEVTSILGGVLALIAGASTGVHTKP